MTLSASNPLRSAVIPWALAAAFALFGAGLGQLYLTARSEAAVLRNQATLAELELRNARQHREAEQLIARRQLSDASAQLAERDAELRDLRDRLPTRGELTSFKIAALTPPAGSSPAALAIVVWNPAAQEGELRVSKLPAPASDKNYQLWLIDPAYQEPVDAGVFTVDPVTGEARVTFRPRRPVKSAAKFAISLERKGGAPQAESPFVLIGD